MRYTFTAYERLKREQHINTLFHTGKAFSVFPLRLLWLIVPRGDEHFPARAGFSVPKKKFKGSVKRHRIVRLMREAYRLNKHDLYSAVPDGKQVHLFFIYNDITMPDYETIKAAVIKGLEQINTNLSA